MEFIIIYYYYLLQLYTNDILAACKQHAALYNNLVIGIVNTSSLNIV